MPGQRAVIGEQQQPLGVEIQPADGDDARHIVRQRVEHGRASLGIAMRGYAAFRLVVTPQPHALGSGQTRAVHGDFVARRHVHGCAGELLAVERDAALRDQALGVAARTDAGPRDHLRDTLAAAVNFGARFTNVCISRKSHIRLTLPVMIRLTIRDLTGRRNAS
jgi:hypothetical protein